MGFFKEFLSLKKNPGPGPGESVFVKEYLFSKEALNIFFPLLYLGSLFLTQLI